MSDGSLPGIPVSSVHPVTEHRSGAEKSPSVVLTLSCPDTTGIVAAVAGFLAANNCLITEAQHFDDPHTVKSFMRTVFHPNGQGTPPLPRG